MVSGPSNWGTAVELWAPGEWQLLGADVEDPTMLTGTSVRGTSFSAPCAAGVGALVLSRFPSLTPQEVHDQLIGQALPQLDVFLDGTFRETDRPMLSACRAVAANTTEESQCTGTQP